ncbi:MAG TPA: hypothetical protein DDZ04_04175 [Parabacteroides sp.]|nr:hypothetical protein [Parabacteroides sp.]
MPGKCPAEGRKTGRTPFEDAAFMPARTSPKKRTNVPNDSIHYTHPGTEWGLGLTRKERQNRYTDEEIGRAFRQGDTSPVPSPRRHGNRKSGKFQDVIKWPLEMRKNV